MLDILFLDVRHAMRGLRRSPGFTVTVVLMLGLGIGANTAIFSIVDRLLLRDLPYPDGDRLVMLYDTFPENERNNVSPANWIDWQRMSQSFEDLAAWNSFSMTLTGEGDPEQLSGQTVSSEFFPAVKVPPLLGRVFTAEDDRPRAPRVVLLSHRLWQRRFGGDPDIIGKAIQLDTTPHEVIGVMPAGFYFVSQDIDYWTPYALDRSRDWRATSGHIIPGILGRLKPSVTLSSAQNEMRVIGRRLEEDYTFNKSTSVNVVPLREVLTGQARRSLLVLFGAVSVLLVIACLNVAGMTLARSASRRRDIAVRTSLGAGRGAIIRYLLAESLILAGAGAVAGFLIALWGVGALVQLTPRNLIRVADVPLDGRVLLYTFAVSALTGLLSGLAPASAATRGSLSEYLHGIGRSITRSARLRQGLVVAQVTMTVVLLCGAGLLFRSFSALNAVRTGVDANDVLTMQVSLPVARYDREQQVEFVRQAVENLQRLPGVQSAGAARSLPVIGPTAGTGFHVQGTSDVSMNERREARIRIATPGYFKTVGVPVVRGRDFTWDDQLPNAELVFIVNETFVKAYFASEDPLAVSMRVFMTGDPPFGRIVGVVRDVSEGSLRNPSLPTIFYNHRHLTYAGVTMFIRSSRPEALTQDALRVIHDLDRNLAVTQVRTIRQALGLSIARERLNAVVSAAFALTALLLASLGLYGLLALLVTERTREIGIRMALGARASGVLQMVLGHGLGLVAVGLIAGLSGALAVTRLIESLLFGVPVHDPATFIGVAALLVAVSTPAAFIPARRATKVDPVIALRQD